MGCSSPWCHFEILAAVMVVVFAVIVVVVVDFLILVPFANVFVVVVVVGLAQTPDSETVRGVWLGAGASAGVCVVDFVVVAV